MLTFETFSAVRAAGDEDAGECFGCQQVCRLAEEGEKGSLTTKEHKEHKEEGTQEVQLLRSMALIIAQREGKPLKRLQVSCDR